MNKPTYYKAVEKIVGKNILLGGSTNGPIGEIIFPEGVSKPSGKEVTDKLAELQAEYDANQYQRNRASAYDSIGNQLDLLFHDMTAGKGSKSGEWYKAIAKVKADNPKG